MNREEKVTSVAELRERFGKASVALVAANLRPDGGPVARAAPRLCAGRAASSRSPSTRSAKIAMQETRYAELRQPAARAARVGVRVRDPVAVAKALVDFADQHNKLQIDGGAVEGPAHQAGPGQGAGGDAGAAGAAGARGASGAVARSARCGAMPVAGARASPARSRTLVKKLEEAGGAA